MKKCIYLLIIRFIYLLYAKIKQMFIHTILADTCIIILRFCGETTKNLHLMVLEIKNRQGFLLLFF